MFEEKKLTCFETPNISKGTRGKMIIDSRIGNLYILKTHLKTTNTLFKEEEPREHERWTKKGTLGKVMLSRWMENK